ncbi:MAG: polysaccharide deacetylase family protein [Vulcanimicrobiaceae bacterium]
MKALRALLRTVAMVVVLAVVLFAAYEYTERPASQLFGKTLVHGPRNQKIVALTFDDGPNPPYTGEILDVLKQDGVHATFFLVGRAVAAYPNVVRREVKLGNAVGNHTWAHQHLDIMTPQQIATSLDRTENAIAAAAGVRPRIMRPPYGKRDWLVLGEVRRLGYTPVMWSVPLAHDWLYPPPKTIARRILRYVRDGSIIVLHDGNQGRLCALDHLAPHVCDRSQDVGATRIIVSTLKREGYRFVTIPQLLRLRPPTRRSGRAGE